VVAGVVLLSQKILLEEKSEISVEAVLVVGVVSGRELGGL